jgi:two-component system, LuxR family, sensor kinase FixL
VGDDHARDGAARPVSAARTQRTFGAGTLTFLWPIADYAPVEPQEVGLKLQDWPRRIGAAASAPPLPLRPGARSLRELASTQLREGLRVTALLVAYLALEWVSFIHEHKGMPVTPWNPALGLVFAAILVKGVAYGLVLFIGVVIAEVLILRTELPWTIVLAMAAVVAASFTLAAVVARRHFRFDHTLQHVRDILVLLATGTAAAAISAILLSTLLLAANELSGADLAQSSLPLFVGDIIGIAVVTPLVLRLSLRWPDVLAGTPVKILPELILYVFAVGGTLWLSLSADIGASDRYLSVLFLPVVAAALRYGIDGSCAALAATQLGLVLLLHQSGYDAAAFTQFQVVMLALTTSGLVVGVVVSERQRANLAAHEAEAKLKDLHAQAARAARMNVVSGMASALAHEINQPMTAARALARSVQQILRAPTAELGRADNNLVVLIAQIDHATGVVRRMRDFLRRGQPRFSTLDLRRVLDDALILVGPDAAAKHVLVELLVDEDLPPVFGDRVQLQQVILNLMHNALDSIAATGRNDGSIRLRAQLSPCGTAIEIGIADNGIGVPKGRLLFEPQTSQKKDGLGLGLSISASIIEAHGGRIWLHSHVQGATELRFTLPLQAQGPNTT